jgi:neopullulanase
MKRLIPIIASLFLFTSALFAFSQGGERISRIEPPFWWTEMKTPLTLMIYGSDLAGSSVASGNENISIEGVRDAESPNYLFIDIKLGENLLPGEYPFTISTKNGEKIAFNYKFFPRRDHSAQRVSFGPSDVLYLLVPDRFSNGDPSNDSSPLTIEKGDRKNLGGRHGGDLKGIENSLDYLADLGVTCIWPIPVLLDDEKSYSYHGYACADYYMVDPRYGNNELYKALVENAHKKGLKFIQDIVLNHCGTAHWWMRDLPFSDWVNQFDEYTVSNFAMSTHSDPHSSRYDLDICTKGWFDRTMPDMNLTNPFVLQYFIQNVVWWIEYADLDGLRVDTFPYSEKNAISKWTSSILKEYPNLTIVGECWFHEVSEIAYWEGGKKSLCGFAYSDKEPFEADWEVRNRDGYTSHLPMVMDFHLQDQISAFNQNKPVEDWGQGIRKVYDSFSLDEVYTQPGNLLVFMSNHDTPRPGYVLERNFNRMKNAYTLILTTRGTPQIYYGDEIMLTSADGTSGHSQERRDFPGGWKGDKVNAFTGKGLTADEKSLQDHVKTLLNFRKTAVAVTQGKMKHFFPASGSNLYVYFRYFSCCKSCTKQIMVMINNSSEAVEIKWDTYQEMFNGKTPTMKDVLTGKTFKVGEPLKVPAMSSIVAQEAK